MAADVARHPFLGSVHALKGGTALNLCFEAPRRLSVDLDFDYIGHVEREKMLGAEIGAAALHDELNVLDPCLVWLERVELAIQVGVDEQV